MVLYFSANISAIGVVIFDKRIGTLDGELEPDSEAQKFISAANSALDGLFQTAMFWSIHKNKKTKVWREFCTSMDYIWELDKYIVRIVYYVYTLFSQGVDEVCKGSDVEN